MAGSGTAHLRPESETLLRAERLVVEFPVGRSGLKVHAVSDVSIDIVEGETVGLVGESGCGKSTTGRAIIQLPRPTGGKVVFDGRDITDLEGEELRQVRPKIQMIFQDPISSLNPRRKVEDIIGEGIRIWRDELQPRPPRPPALTIAAVLTIVLGGLTALSAAVGFVLALVGGASLADMFWVTVLVAALGGLAYFEVQVGRALLERQRSAWVAAIGLWAVILTLGAILAVTLVAVSGGLVLALVALPCLLARSSRRVFPPLDRAGIAAKVDEVLDAVGIDPAVARGRRPHQFSGGQCQRISIARAIVTDPKVIICDEPVSALDVSVQAQILNLLEEMKIRYGLTLVFIAHDLAVVKNVSDRVVVMYLGKICEVAPPDELYAHPAHPYTAALLGAIPVPDPTIRAADRPVLGGEIPSPVAPPSGCRFRTRCPKAQEKCAAEEPILEPTGDGHYVACHFPLAPGEGLPSSNGNSSLA